MSELRSTIWPLLQNTPWWVYLLFIYVVWKGIRSSRPRLVSLKKLCIFPVILLLVSIYGLLTVLTPSFESIAVWVLFLFIGGCLAFVQINRQALFFDKKKHLVQTPRTWSVLILILIIFFSKYYFDYTLIINPQAIHHLIFKLCLIGISGLCNGLLIGRLCAYLYKMRQAEHVELK